MLLSRLAALALAIVAIAIPAASPAAEQSATGFGRFEAGNAWYPMSANYKRASRFELTENGSVTALVAHVDGLGGTSGSQQLRYGVYADEAGRPGALLAQSAVVTVDAGQAAGWVQAALPSPLELGPGWYHLAIQSGSSGSVARYSRTAAADGLVSNGDQFSDGLASPFDNASSDDWELAIHALLGDAPGRDTTPPSAPGNPSVTSTTATSLAFSWTAATDDVGVSGYGTYLDGALVETTTTTGYTFTGLTCDTSYTLAVDATDAAGNRSTRTTTTARTAACPAAPTTGGFGRFEAGSAWYPMSANYKRASRFELTENGSVTALVAHVDGLGGTSGSQQLRYGVYADEAGRPGALLAQSAIVTITSGQAAGWVQAALSSPLQLGPGWYHLAIQSGSSGSVARYSRAAAADGLVSNRDEFSDGLASTFGTASPDNWQLAVHALLGDAPGRDTTPPSAPGNPTVTSTTATSLALSWTAATDDVRVTGYGAYLDGTLADETTNTSYSFTGLTCDTSYTLAVDAFDAAGNRSTRTTTTARTAACPTVGAPQNVRVSGATGTSLAIVWDAVAGATRYGAYLNGSRVAEPTSTSFTFDGLTCGTSYALGVDAVDSGGDRSATTTLATATAACPPPPGGTACTRTLAPGGSLGTFLNGLRAGEVGCLRGGTYSVGSVTWSASGGTVQAYPGEQPVLTGSKIVMSGSGQTMRGFTIEDVSGDDAVRISGSGARVEGMQLGSAPRHGILLNTSARNATIARNYIRDAGIDTLDHGIYVQGSGHVIVNNVIVRPSGYAVHLYSSPSDIVVAQNTLVGSRLRAGVLVRTSGTGIRVVNNIVANNTTHGINYHSCGGSCLVDGNLAWNNGSGAVSSAGAGVVTNTTVADPQFVDSAFRVAATSPAVDSARADYSYGPDRDGVARPRGAGPDKGAYERSR